MNNCTSFRAKQLFSKIEVVALFLCSTTFSNCRIDNPLFDDGYQLSEESDSDALDSFYSIAPDGGGTSTSGSGTNTASDNASNSDSDSTVGQTEGITDDTSGVESGSSDSGETGQTSSSSDSDGTDQTSSSSDSDGTGQTSSSSDSDGTEPNQMESETGQTSSTTETSETTDVPCERYVCMAHNENRPTDTDRGPMDRLYAIPFEADVDHIVVGAEIITGIKSGTNRLAIWNNSGDDPGYELSGGSWRIDENIGWQGCDFETPVSVSEGQKFWVVWDAIGYSQATVASSGTTIYGRSSPDGGDSWETNGWKWKMRVYCCE